MRCQYYISLRFYIDHLIIQIYKTDFVQNLNDLQIYDTKSYLVYEVRNYIYVLSIGNDMFLLLVRKDRGTKWSRYFTLNITVNMELQHVSI